MSVLEGLFRGFLDLVHKNQTIIEKRLGNPTLRELSNADMISKLTTILTEIGISNSDEVSEAVVNEAKFWHSRLK